MNKPARIASTLSLLLLAALVFLPGRASSGDAEFTVNFGTVAPDGTPWATQLQDIKKRIEQDSEGRIKIRVFLGGVLGGEVEMVRDIVDGGRLQGGGFSAAAVATPSRFGCWSGARCCR